MFCGDISDFVFYCCCFHVFVIFFFSYFHGVCCSNKLRVKCWKKEIFVPIFSRIKKGNKRFRVQPPASYFTYNSKRGFSFGVFHSYCVYFLGGNHAKTGISYEFSEVLLTFRQRKHMVWNK